MEIVKTEQSNDLENFVDFLYDGLQGYVYLAGKNPEEPNPEKAWMQEFFEWPARRNDLLNIIRGASDKIEVYLAPAIFKVPDGSRTNVKASNVAWTEFDGNAPDWNNSNRPSLIVQSSLKGHEHGYWRLSEPETDIDRLEDVNRRITYGLNGDFSAWDANQVLRPPDTWNHKRSANTTLSSLNDTSYDIDYFFSLYDEPPKTEEIEWGLSELEDAQVVILRHAFTPDLINLLGKERKDLNDRSSALMQMAYGCAQMQLSNNEIMSILLLCDDRWEKFKGRRDRHKQLSHIIAVARNKHPLIETEDTDDDVAPIYALGWQSFLATEINIEWVIEPMLMDQGNMLLVGPSGVGKTQWSLDVAICLALGRDFMHYKVHKQQKIVFVSLEMGHGELKQFASKMTSEYSDEDLAVLEENLIVVPFGEPLALNSLEGQQTLEKILDEVQPNGLMVDSIGSSVQGNISSDENVQPLTRFNDRIRKKYGLFTWYIHHMRKQGDRQVTSDEVYGNQYLVNRSTSTYALLKTKDKRIKVANLKMRLSAEEQSYHVLRDEHLMFHKATEDVDTMIANNLNNGSGPSVGNTPPKSMNGNFDL